MKNGRAWGSANKKPRSNGLRGDPKSKHQNKDSLILIGLMPRLKRPALSRAWLNQPALPPHGALSLCDEQHPLIKSRIASNCPQMSCDEQAGVVGGVQDLLGDDSHPFLLSQQVGVQLVVEQLFFGAQGATQHAESRIRCSSDSTAETPSRLLRVCRS
jgi:hypothetical protein